MESLVLHCRAQVRTFPQYCKRLFAETAGKRKKGVQETYTSVGAGKVVNWINLGIFVVILFSARSPVPSIAPSKKQDEKEMPAKGVFFYRGDIKELYLSQNIFTISIA